MGIILIAQAGGISAPAITTNRPRWEDVYKNYPKNTMGTDDMFGPDFYKLVLKEDYNMKTYKNKNGDYLYNACAGKVSMALTLSGLEIKKYKTIGRDYTTSKDSLMKGKGFISTASKMKKWLDEVWGEADFNLKTNQQCATNTINEFKNIIGNNKKGIYLMLAKDPNDFGASGHVTLWTGNPNEEWVFGKHHYDIRSKEMYFWELK